MENTQLKWFNEFEKNDIKIMSPRNLDTEQWLKMLSFM